MNFDRKLAVLEKVAAFRRGAEGALGRLGLISGGLSGAILGARLGRASGKKLYKGSERFKKHIDKGVQSLDEVDLSIDARRKFRKKELSQDEFNAIFRNREDSLVKLRAEQALRDAKDTGAGVGGPAGMVGGAALGLKAGRAMGRKVDKASRIRRERRRRKAAALLAALGVGTGVSAKK